MNKENLQKKLEKKTARREAKRKKQMKVSGGSVKNLQKIIKQKGLQKSDS